VSPPRGWLDQIADEVSSSQDTGEMMDEFAADYFQSELARSISDLQYAHAALLRAQSAATLMDEDAKELWKLVHANTRSALLLACTISVRETAIQLSRSDQGRVDASPDASLQ
jgi:hypothetical protein